MDLIDVGGGPAPLLEKHPNGGPTTIGKDFSASDQRTMDIVSGTGRLDESVGQSPGTHGGHQGVHPSGPI